MREAYETIEKNGFTAKIYQDEIDESPREWDNLGKMVCWHSRYTLGDVKLLDNYCYTKECKLKDLTDNCNGWDEVEEVLKKEFNAIICLPLFLYDHSGISMHTYPHGQHAGWDGGYIGFIYVTKEDILKEYSTKRITKSMLEKATKILEGEVETYNQYLTGDVYYYNIEDEEGNSVDSCGGFYGMEYCIEEVNRQLDYCIKEKEENLKSTKALVLG